MFNLHKIFSFKSIYNFKKYNKKFFYKKKADGDYKVLVEFNGFYSTYPFLALISNFFSNKKNSKIVAFNNYKLTTENIEENFFKRLKWFFGDKLSLRTWGIYKSFGTKHFINPSNLKNNSETVLLYNFILNSINEKNDISKIKYKNIIIGDLIYDGYLKLFNETTIDIKDYRFKKYLNDCILLVNFWDNYFASNKINYIIGCHLSYAYGFVFRVALLHNIKSCVCQNGKLFRIQKNRLQSWLTFKDYRFQFNQLTSSQKINALNLADNLLKKKFLGFLGSVVKDNVASRSAYHKNYDVKKSVLNKNNKIKVLICTHSVGDSIYAHGDNLFSDFYEWLSFLNKVSLETDYDWYIKDHPRYDKIKAIRSNKRTYKLSKSFVKKNNKLNYINPNTSHHQILQEGIDFVLTMYGSVAHEYAYHNVPVLTASKNCPTINYNFNIHSKNIDDYKNKLKNLHNLKVNIKKNEILEYVFMSQIFNDSDCLFDEYTSFIDISKNKSYDDYDSFYFLNYWMKQVDKKKLLKMNKLLELFFSSNDYSLNLIHNKSRFNSILSDKT